MTLRSLSPIELTRPSATAIMPLESFSTPAELDGSVGENRCLGRSRINAENDHQAIQAWLKSFETSLDKPLPLPTHDETSDLDRLIEAAKSEVYTRHGETITPSPRTKEEQHGAR